MSVTINTLTFDNLTAVPLEYDEVDTRNGLTAKAWQIEGLLTVIEYADLLTIYDNWRDVRILEEKAETSLVVGTTVSVTVTGTGGATATPCWFSSAPTASQSGTYLAVSFNVVDAAEALEVLGQQENDEGDDTYVVGTFAYGGVTIQLTRPLEGYRQAPNVELTAGGTHYVSGPRYVERLRIVEGFFDIVDFPTGIADISTQYETDIQATLTASTYRPIQPPSFSAGRTVRNGAETTRITVSMQLLFLL